MASEVKRYDASDSLNMRECEGGDYVLAIDHDRVVAELRAEVDRLSGIVSHVRMQASIQAQEARTQKSIVTEIGAMVGCAEDWLTAGAVRAALDAKEQGEWIACAERLPEARVPVLLWCSGSDSAGVGWLTIGGWYTLEPQAIASESITHWRPLPAAPSRQDA